MKHMHFMHYSIVISKSFRHIQLLFKTLSMDQDSSLCLEISKAMERLQVQKSVKSYFTWKLQNE